MTQTFGSLQVGERFLFVHSDAGSSGLCVKQANRRYRRIGVLGDVQYVGSYDVLVEKTASAEGK